MFELVLLHHSDQQASPDFDVSSTLKKVSHFVKQLVKLIQSYEALLLSSQSFYY